MPRVEQILGKFAFAVTQIAKLERIGRRREDANRAASARKKARIEYHRAKYEAEKQRVDAFKAALSNYETATRIRTFVTTLQSASVLQIREPLPEGDSDLSLWLTWANGYVHWLDPTVVSPPSVMGSPP